MSPFAARSFRSALACALLALVVFAMVVPRASAREVRSKPVKLRARQLRSMAESGWNLLPRLLDGGRLHLPGGEFEVSVDRGRVAIVAAGDESARPGRPVRVTKAGAIVELVGAGPDGASFELVALRHPRFDIAFAVGAAARTTRLGRTTIVLLDTNLNGRPGDANEDAILLERAGRVRILPHASFVPVDDRPLSLSVDADGTLAMAELDLGLTVDELEGVVRLNQYRAAAGLGLLAIDDAMCLGARRHCEYVRLNPDEFGHFETVGRPGYSPEGHRAARIGCLGKGGSAANFVDAFVATLYHRYPLLADRVTGLGIAGRGRAVVVAPTGNVSVHERRLFPVPDQLDVPLRYDPLEMQCPRRGAGYPITVRGPRVRGTTAVTATLMAAGSRKPLACDVSWPGRPALEDRPANREAILVLPTRPLAANTEHRVRIVWTCGGETETLEWRFFTGEDRPYR